MFGHGGCTSPTLCMLLKEIRIANIGELAAPCYIASYRLQSFSHNEGNQALLLISCFNFVANVEGVLYILLLICSYLVYIFMAIVMYQ